MASARRKKSTSASAEPGIPGGPGGPARSAGAHLPSPPASAREAWMDRAWLWWGLSCAAVAVAFAPGVGGEWLWDDEALVVAPRLMRGLDGLVRIWTGDGTPDYFPLTSTSFWVERRVFAGPLGHRVVNLALHALNACLVGAVAARARVPHGRFVGLLFAVHPMVVSSAAWVAERKNTLSLCFALAALIAALPREAVFPTRRRLGAMGALFALGLLAKTQIVGLPVVIAGLWWLRGRDMDAGRPPRDAWVALGAMLGTALGLGLVTIHFQRAVTRSDAGDLVTRVVRAADALAFHVAHAVWPSPLAMVHARDAVRGDGASGWLALVGLLAISVGLAVHVARDAHARTSRVLLVATVSYVAMLGPTLGLLDMAFMRFSFVAEHFGYPALPILLAVIVGASGRLPRRVALPLLGLVVLALGVVTRDYASHFVSRRALWSHNVRTVPTAATALGNHALSLQDDGRPRDALRAAREAVRRSPTDADLHCFLGVVLLGQRAMPEARAALEQALVLDPKHARALNNLATVLVYEGDLDGGIAHLRRALAIEPDYALGHMNLARLLAARGELDAAQREQARAITLDAKMRDVPLVPDPGAADVR